MLFKVSAFEGPLELMLHLISKHKLNIHDIEITELLTQYLAYIEEMKAADLDVTTDFLVMAARLVYIKTTSLLPVHDESDELKKELEGQLLEYQLCKLIANKMRDMYLGGVVFVREPTQQVPDMVYRREHNADELLQAYVIAAGKGKRRLPPPKGAFSAIVSRRMVSVESRIVYVLKKLYEKNEVPYDEFFYSNDEEYHFDKSELVATFLAMLELIKSKRVRISDDNKTIIFNRSLPLDIEKLDDIGVKAFEEEIMTSDGN